MTAALDDLRSALADRYVVDRLVGRGGMATVYLARDVKHDRRVALKVLLPELASAIGTDRFLKEIEIAARLSHPHIIPLHDSGEAYGYLYFVMPFIEGGSLRTVLLREGYLDPHAAIAIATHVGDAVSYAHRQDVLHRDLKPENVLMSEGHAMVADFGIARAISKAGGVKLTGTGFPLGTPGYMSPEQAAGLQDLDERTDVYSLACVCFEMLVGETPGKWLTDEAVKLGRLTDAPPAQRERLDRIGIPIERTLVRALATQAHDRYATVEAFISGLIEAAEAKSRRRSPQSRSPRWAFWLGSRVAARPARLAAASAPPLHLSRFVGREKELAQTKELLTSHRLVTLTGAGGSGKTRLAAQLAQRLASEEDRSVAWAELAPLAAPTLVPAQVASALGVLEDHSTYPSLVKVLSDRRVLLVLDNCEHLIDACADLADTLLRNCPNVTILATSREALGIPGERVWQVPPLSLPEDPNRAAAEGSEAVRLFVDRAQAVAPSFALTDENAAAIVAICRRLDGLPLAIELAAAQAKVLSPRQIGDRLNESFHLLTTATAGRTATPRHKTLHAAVDWSYALLSQREQSLLRRLSVFVDGFTVAAAENVCVGWGIERPEVLPFLSALVDKSLIPVDTRGNEARYRLLETVRQYLLERLRDAGEEHVLRDRHTAYYLQLAEAAEAPMFGGAGDAELVGRLESEHANFRAAADWCEQDPARVEQALRLGIALHWFWFARGHFREGRTRLTTALEASRQVDPILRAKALTALGHVALWQGDFPAVRTAMEECVPILRASGDRRFLASALAGLGAAASRDGRHAESARVLDEALSNARTLGPGVLLGFVLYWRGLSYEAAGEYGNAGAAFKEANHLARRIGHKPAIAHSLHVLGRLARFKGDYAAALTYLRESLAVHHQTGDRWGVLRVIEELAQVAQRQRQPESVVRLLGAAEALREGMGIGIPEAERQETEQLMAATRATLGESAFADAWAAGRALPLDSLLEGAEPGPSS